VAVGRHSTGDGNILNAHRGAVRLGGERHELHGVNSADPDQRRPARRTNRDRSTFTVGSAPGNERPTGARGRVQYNFLRQRLRKYHSSGLDGDVPPRGPAARAGCVTAQPRQQGDGSGRRPRYTAMGRSSTVTTGTEAGPRRHRGATTSRDGQANGGQASTPRYVAMVSNAGRAPTPSRRPHPLWWTLATSFWRGREFCRGFAGARRLRTNARHRPSSRPFWSRWRPG